MFVEFGEFMKEFGVNFTYLCVCLYVVEFGAATNEGVICEFDFLIQTLG